MAKICTKCKLEKLLEDFYKNKNTKDGLCCWCKKCTQIVKKVYQQKNKKEIAKKKKMYREKNREKILTRGKKYYRENKEIFAKKAKIYRFENKADIALWKKENYQNNKEKFKQYREDNKEKIAAEIKKYQQSAKGKEMMRRARHKRRARKFDAEYEIFNPKYIFERDGYICQSCGKKTRPDFKNVNHKLYPNLDHIIPLSKGGGHTKKNTQCLCHGCNNTKGSNNYNDQLLLFG